MRNEGKPAKSGLSPFIILCLVGGLAIFSSTASKNPVLPLFIRAMGVPISTVGFIAAASTVVGIVVSLPAGILSDIIGRRRMVLAATFVFATAPFLYLLVQEPWQLVLVRIYHGLATAILGPVAMAAVAGTFDERRGERMGWYSSATMVGRFVAPFVGGALIFGQDYHWAFIACGIAGTLSLIGAVRLLTSASASAMPEVTLRRRPGVLKKEIVTVLTHPGILGTSLMEAVQYFAFGAVETFLPIYLSEQARFSPLQIGSLFTVQILVAALTKPVMGRLSDRYGRVFMIAVGLALCGITMAFMTRTVNYAVLVGLIGLFGLGLATTTASTAALVADLSRASSHGTSLGILSSVMDVGHSTGPMVAGVLIGAYRYGATFGWIGAALVAVSLVYGVLMRRVTPPQRA